MLRRFLTILDRVAAGSVHRGSSFVTVAAPLVPLSMTQTRFRLPALLSAFSIMLLCTPAAQSGVINIGFLSFDVLLSPVGASPGVNVFDIANFTGDPASSGFALPPDFPVLTFVTLQNASLLFNSTGSPVTLPDIAPGQLDQGVAPQFSGDTLFTSALFTATLTETTLSLDGGGTFIADPTITATLLPSSGPNLIAGTDLVVLQATEAVSAAPEPSSIVMIALAIMAALAAKLSLKHQRH